MSEDEIIEIVKNEITNTYAEGKAIALQGLLDLYQKEKEKNKELENADLTTVYLNGFYDGEKKWKDKIREKIEYYKKIDNAVGITIFSKLLEENNGE